jgi:hypothetical protein
MVALNTAALHNSCLVCRNFLGFRDVEILEIICPLYIWNLKSCDLSWALQGKIVV